MYKKLIALLLVFIFTVQLPFAGYQKGQVYAAAALPIIAGAGETLTSLICSAAACIGLVVTAKNISGDLKDMTAEEQEEYYNTVAANNKEAIKKLYDDGYFSGAGEIENAIGAMLQGDDTACAVSLKKVLEEKEMEEEKDIKTYESGKKDDNGKNKPLVAVSGRLLDLLVDVIGDAVGNMIEDKQDADTLPYFPKWDGYGNHNYIIYKWNGNYYLLQYSGNVPGLQRDKYNTGDDYVFARYAGPNYVLKDGTWQTADFQFSSPTISNDNGCYNFSGRVEFLYYDNSYYFYTYNRGTYVGNEKIAPNPYPWPEEETQPATVTEIVNNYFGDEITNFYEDVYNYTTNNSNNNYFTENKYLLPTDPTDVAKDIIVPAETIINNTYNNISPDVTVDQDYINNVVVPSIIAGINANLKLNTDINMGDLTIDNVMDFTGNNADDDRWDKVTFWGLEKKFPFCLPFDLYDFLSILDAEPRAPAFTVVIPLSSFGFGLKDISFEVDLSYFDDVMQILRTMELLGSVLGLIFITKKILF